MLQHDRTGCNARDRASLSNQESTVVVNTACCSANTAADFVDGYRPSAQPVVAAPETYECVEPLRFELQECVDDLVDQCRCQRFPGRWRASQTIDIDRTLRPGRCLVLNQLSRQVEIDADPRDDRGARFAAVLRLDEQATQLAVVCDQVVGPFERYVFDAGRA